MAKLLDIPSVIVYGSTDPTYEGLDCDQAIVPEQKASYQPEEYPKAINSIRPEEISNAALKATGQSRRVEDETIFIGPQYGKIYIEIVPNAVVDPQFLQGQSPTLRCDYEYNEQILAQNLSHTRCSIVTDKKTNLDLYRQFRQNIVSINFKVSMGSDLDYIKKLRNIGIEVKLWFDDVANKNNILFKFLDIEQPYFLECKSFDLDIPEGAKYRSFKYILSGGNIYISKHAYLEGRAVDIGENWLDVGEVNEDFQREMEYFKIFT